MIREPSNQSENSKYCSLCKRSPVNIHACKASPLSPCVALLLRGRVNEFLIPMQLIEVKRERRKIDMHACMHASALYIAAAILLACSRNLHFLIFNYVCLCTFLHLLLLPGFFILSLLLPSKSHTPLPFFPPTSSFCIIIISI